MSVAAKPAGTTAQRDVEVVAEAGLHARPAAEFAAVAARSPARITVEKADRVIDATSVLLLLTLDVRQGDHLVIRADGPDAQSAVDTLAQLLEKQ